MCFIDWREKETGQFSRLLFVHSSPLEEAYEHHGAYGAARNCVSRNHGITGCRSLVDVVAGGPGPDNFISRSTAGVVLPPRERVESSAMQPDERGRRRVCLVNIAVRNQTVAAVRSGKLNRRANHLLHSSQLYQGTRLIPLTNLN